VGKDAELVDMLAISSKCEKWNLLVKDCAFLCLLTFLDAVVQILHILEVLESWILNSRTLHLFAALAHRLWMPRQVVEACRQGSGGGITARNNDTERLVGEILGASFKRQQLIQKDCKEAEGISD